MSKENAKETGFRTVSFQKVVKLTNELETLRERFRTVSFQKVVKLHISRNAFDEVLELYHFRRR